MGDKRNLLEACGEEVGISDAEERVRQGRAGGCVTYSIGICKLMVMSFAVAVIYLQSLFIVTIRRRSRTNRTTGRRNLETANGNVWRSKPLPKISWAVSNRLARWRVNCAHHSKRQGNRKDQNQDRHDSAAGKAPDACTTPALTCSEHEGKDFEPEWSTYFCPEVSML